MRSVNLRAVQTVSFRQSEATNFLEFEKKHRALARQLKTGDAVLFISQTGDQLVFVYGFSTAHDEGRIGRVLRSERLRLTAGAWSPLMLQDYAKRVGLQLRGHKTFEDWFWTRKGESATRRKAAAE